jgi:drug/metabolite transporter (DMT)-like permease
MGGLALAFAGMMAAFGVPAPPSSPYQLLGDLMMAAAALCWAATTLFIKVSALSRISAEKTLLYQLAVSIPILAGGAVVFGERIVAMPSALATGALAYQIVVVGLTYSAWFALIVKFSASRLSAFTFLTPLFGVAAGHFVLGEPLTPAFALAVAPGGGRPDTRQPAPIRLYLPAGLIPKKWAPVFGKDQAQTTFGESSNA